MITDTQDGFNIGMLGESRNDSTQDITTMTQFTFISFCYDKVVAPLNRYRPSHCKYFRENNGWDAVLHI